MKKLILAIVMFILTLCTINIVLGVTQEIYSFTSHIHDVTSLQYYSVPKGNNACKGDIWIMGKATDNKGVQIDYDFYLSLQGTPVFGNCDRTHLIVGDPTTHFYYSIGSKTFSGYYTGGASAYFNDNLGIGSYVVVGDLNLFNGNVNLTEEIKGPLSISIYVNSSGQLQNFELNFNGRKISYSNAQIENKLNDHEQRIVALESSSDGSGGNDDYDSRISALESWKTTITNWKDDVDDEISDLWNAVSGGGGEKLINYFKYFSSSDRKRVVCGYGIENNLTEYIDLGYNCTISYRTSSTGRISSSCRCKTLD